MMPIDGYYRIKGPLPIEPCVQARVCLSRIHVCGLVTFLVDTGADITIVNLEDVAAPTIDASLLDPEGAFVFLQPRWPATGL